MSARRPGLVIDDYGSRLYEGKRWSVLDARGPVFGPTHHRQLLANGVGSVGCVCYVEQHLNAVAVPQPEAIYDGAGRVVSVDRRKADAFKHPPQFVFAVMNARHAASSGAVNWARDYTARVAASLSIADRKVVVGGPGSGNLTHVKCPAMLVEPGMISDPLYRARISTGEGLDALAVALASSIMRAFPAGGIVGLSVGHKYRGTGDMGAPAAGAEDPAWDQEAEIAEEILNTTTEILLNAA